MSRETGQCNEEARECRSNMKLVALDEHGRAESFGVDARLARSGAPLQATSSTRTDRAQTHDCVLQTSGRVLCRGHNGHGQLGLPFTQRNRSAEHREVPGLPNMTEIQVVEHRSCARSSAGALWCWGEDFGAPAPLELGAEVRSWALGPGALWVVLEDNSVRRVGDTVPPVPNEETVRQVTSGGCVLVGAQGAVWCFDERSSAWSRELIELDEPVRELLGDGQHRVTQSGRLLRAGEELIRDVQFAAANEKTVCAANTAGALFCEGRLESFGSQIEGCSIDFMTGW